MTKILLATMALDIGGAETHVTELAKALCRSGYEVTVASAGGVYVGELTAAGVKHVCVPLHSKKPHHVLASYRRLKALIQKEKFDVVHAHARIPAFVCGRLSKKLGFRFVTSAHGTFDVNLIWKMISNWGEKTLAVSYDIKEYLINNYGVPADNISITINGIDTERYRPQADASKVIKEFGLHTDGRKILYVSRIDNEAAHIGFQLAEAAPALAQGDEALQIVMVGGGTAFERLKKKVDAANAAIGRRVLIMTGARTDINAFCAWADLFVGVSRAALEAMSAGCAAVLSGSQGYLGVFDEQNLSAALDTNFTCRGRPVSTAQMLLQDINRIFSMSAEARRAMGAYNRGIVKQYYSIQRMADDAAAVYRSVMPYEKYKYGDIVLGGYYGFGNTGDDALLQVILERIRQVDPNARITVLSRRPAKTRRSYCVNSVNRFHPLALARTLAKGRVLVYGGGSLLQSATSARSLFYYIWLLKLAKCAGIKTMLFANGIGPFVTARDEKRAASALESVDLITLRDKASYESIKALGVRHENLYLSADPVFHMKGADKGWCTHLLARAGLAPGEQYFVISLRAWRHLDRNFEEKFTRFCLAVKQRYGLRPLMIPMQREKDDRLCRVLAHNTGGVVIEGLSPAEVFTVVAGARLVCGMRLHTLIYAAASAVPVVGLSYDPKIDALFSELDCPRVMSASQVDEQRLMEFASAALCEDREAIAHKAEVLSQRAQVSLEKLIELYQQSDE